MKKCYVRWLDKQGHKFEKEFNTWEEADKFYLTIINCDRKECTTSQYGSIVGVFPSMKATEFICV